MSYHDSKYMRMSDGQGHVLIICVSHVQSSGMVFRSTSIMKNIPFVNSTDLSRWSSISVNHGLDRGLDSGSNRGSPLPATLYYTGEELAGRRADGEEPQRTSSILYYYCRTPDWIICMEWVCG